MPDRTFTRTREEFGEEALAILKGVRQILRALEAGYQAYNNIPPVHHAATLDCLGKLIRSTQKVYVDGETLEE